MRRVVLTLLAGTIILHSAFASARPLHVAVDGSDNQDGSSSRPFATLGYAARIAEAGDTVFVHGGRYRETLAPIHSGRRGAPILFQAYGGGDVVIDAAGLRHGVMLWKVSYIVIKGLTIRGCTATGIHIHHHMDSPSNGSDHNLIEQNRIEDCGSHGIYVGGDGNQVVGNRIERNGAGSASGSAGHGIYLLGDANRIIGNSVSDNAGVGIRAEGRYNRILGNKVSCSAMHGIGVWVDSPLTGHDITIQDNTLINNAGDGIQINGGGSGGKPDAIGIYCNVVATLRNTGRAIAVLNGAGNIHIAHNLLVGNYDPFIVVDAGSARGLQRYDNTFSRQTTVVRRDTFQAIGHNVFNDELDQNRCSAADRLGDLLLPPADVCSSETQTGVSFRTRPP